MLSLVVIGYAVYLCANGNPQGACKFLLVALVLFMLFPSFGRDLESGNFNINIERNEVQNEQVQY